MLGCSLKGASIPLMAESNCPVSTRNRATISPPLIDILPFKPSGSRFVTLTEKPPKPAPVAGFRVFRGTGDFRDFSSDFWKIPRRFSHHFSGPDLPHPAASLVCQPRFPDESTEACLGARRGLRLTTRHPILTNPSGSACPQSPSTRGIAGETVWSRRGVESEMAVLIIIITYDTFMMRR